MKRYIYFFIFIFLFLRIPDTCAQVLTIERCYDLARSRNLNFKRQESEVRLNTIREEQAIYNFFPKIKADTSLAEKNTENNNRFIIAMEQPIYHFGELTNRVNETKARCMGSIFQLSENELQLEKTIYQAYMNVIRQKKLKKNREIGIERVKKEIKLINDEVEKQKRDYSSINRWKVLLSSYEDDLARLNNDLTDSYINLKRVLEYDIISEIKIIPCGLEEFDANQETVKKYFSENTIETFQKALFDYAKVFSPAIKKWDQDVRVAQFSLAAEKAANYPKIDFTPRYEGAGLSSGPNPVRRTPDLNVGFSVKFSFLDMTSWQNISYKREQLNQVKIDRNIFVRDRVASISSNFSRSYTSMQKVIISLQQTKDARLYLNRMESKYSQSNASDIDLIDAYNSYFNSKVQEINSLYNYYNEKKDMYVLIGCSDYLSTPTLEEFLENRNTIDYDLNDLYYKDAKIFEVYSCIKNNDLDGVMSLLKKNPDLMKGTIYTKWTPLHFTAYFGNSIIAQYLIKTGANVNARTISGLTPTYIASDQGNSDTLSVFVNNGGDINIPTGISKWTPLMRASKRGFIDIVELLLKNGANVNERSICGWTALHNAAEEGHISIIQKLIDNGADISIKTNSGNTAQELAASEDFTEASSLLKMNEKESDDAVNNVYKPFKTKIKKSRKLRAGFGNIISYKKIHSKKKNPNSN